MQEYTIEILIFATGGSRCDRRVHLLYTPVTAKRIASDAQLAKQAEFADS